MGLRVLFPLLAAALLALPSGGSVRTENFNLGWEFKLGDFAVSFAKSGLCGKPGRPTYDNGSVEARGRVGSSTDGVRSSFARTRFPDGWKSGRGCRRPRGRRWELKLNKEN